MLYISAVWTYNSEPRFGTVVNKKTLTLITVKFCSLVAVLFPLALTQLSKRNLPGAHPPAANATLSSTIASMCGSGGALQAQKAAPWV